jgi:hypothetical protein
VRYRRPPGSTWPKYYKAYLHYGRSQWPSGLRRGSEVAWWLGSLVRVLLIPGAERSKARVCGRSLAEVAGSKPVRGMDVYIVCCKSRGKQNAGQSRQRNM